MQLLHMKQSMKPPSMRSKFSYAHVNIMLCGTTHGRNVGLISNDNTAPTDGLHGVPLVCPLLSTGTLGLLEQPKADTLQHMYYQYTGLCNSHGKIPCVGSLQSWVPSPHTT